MLFTASELSEIFAQTVNVSITGIAIDSRLVKPGDLFVALSGEKCDGHDFVASAIQHGAAIALVEKPVIGLDQCKLILCDSTLDGLTKLARYNVQQASTQLIGITGSVGKTSTKDMLAHILNRCNKQVYASHKNFNSKIGLPMCAALMPRNSDIGIFEMGMSSIGDINHLVSILPPNIAVITQICEAHGQFFQSQWDIARAKSEIFNATICPEIAIIPGESPYCDFLMHRAKKQGIKQIYTVGKEFARIINCSFSNNMMHINAAIDTYNFEYTIHNANDALAYNSIIAILIAYLVTGINPATLSESLRNFNPVHGRGNVHVFSRNIVIDETYNACPTSMRAAIRTLGTYKNYRKILIIGDMLELGDDAKQQHENLSATIDKYNIDKVFACGAMSKYLFNNLRTEVRGEWAFDANTLAEQIKTAVADNDCILIKGSHSLGMSVIVNQLCSYLGENKHDI